MIRLLCGTLLRKGASQCLALPATLNVIAPQVVVPATARLLPAASSGSDLTTSRGFSASAVAAAESLPSVLRKELKHEKSTYEKPEVVAKGPPAPFTLSETPGDTTLTLTRDYKGESVSIDCSVNLQDSLSLPSATTDDGDDEGDEFEEEGGEVSFNVTVTKGEESLVFECVSDGTYWDIRHVSLEPADGLDSETAYTGPVFQELDEQLQAGFRKYLEDRGVSEDLGEYLRQLLWDKENQEYMGWLDKVASFTGSK